MIASRSGLPLLYRLYERRLERQLQGTVPPHHVGVILDGNRRWAKRQNGRAGVGHRAGAAVITEFLAWCQERSIDVVTLYLLSGDNLKHRSHEELDELCAIIVNLVSDLRTHAEWRIRHVGAVDSLPSTLADVLSHASAATEQAAGITVNLAVGYGGRREIADAVRSLALERLADGADLASFADAVTEDDIARHLYTGGQPDPELILRTSGEQRLSDFLLWQSAHSEFYFAEVLWPDFRKIDFLRALRAYAQRQRRFGS